jgi:hypothetical protein
MKNIFHSPSEESVSAPWKADASILANVSLIENDRLCGLVVRVSGYRSRGPGFDSRPYQIFWEVRGVERGLLSLVRTSEELLEGKSNGSGLENRD